MTDILITGGTGFLGQAITKRLLASRARPEDRPGRICIFSRSESNQAKMRQELGNPPECRWFIGDVRDRTRLRRAMNGVDVVIHAAALKRVEVGEYNPTEMVRTNVDGAENIIEAALDAQVKQVIAISTDKAVNPSTLYGASKMVSERLFLAANALSGRVRTKFSVVRYGNVANSTGSVIPTWKKYPEAAWMTNPECTRFWMVEDEAVKIVMHAIQRNHGGDLLIPSLPAYRLGDLAKAMGITPVITGLTKGEKMHELLIGREEAHEFILDAGAGAAAGNYFAYQPHPARKLDEFNREMSSLTARRMTIHELQEAIVCLE